MKFIFGIQINIEVFYKLILSVWVCIGRHAQSMQNKISHIFAISPGKHGVEVDFLPANDHESLLQVDSITLGLCNQACSKYLKQ